MPKSTSSLQERSFDKNHTDQGEEEPKEVVGGEEREQESSRSSEWVDEGDVSNARARGDIVEGMDPAGFSGPSEDVVEPLTPEALVAFKATQDKAGVVYISRIPPGMRPPKVRHLMGAYGEVGRVYLQQEGTWAHVRPGHQSVHR